MSSDVFTQEGYITALLRSICNKPALWSRTGPSSLAITAGGVSIDITLPPHAVTDFAEFSKTLRHELLTNYPELFI